MLLRADDESDEYNLNFIILDMPLLTNCFFDEAKPYFKLPKQLYKRAFSQPTNHVIMKECNNDGSCVKSRKVLVVKSR